MLSWAPNRVHTRNGISIGSAVLHTSRQKVPILYNEPPFPLKIAPSHRDLNLHHGSLGAPETITQTASRSVKPFFCRNLDRDRQTDRQTDHSTTPVTIGHLYVVLRCDLKRKWRRKFKVTMSSALSFTYPINAIDTSTDGRMNSTLSLQDSIIWYSKSKGQNVTIDKSQQTNAVLKLQR